jgi:hypothetical protein
MSETLYTTQGTLGGHPTYTIEEGYEARDRLITQARGDTTLVGCPNCGAHQLFGRPCECAGRSIDWPARKRRVMAWYAGNRDRPRHRWSSYEYEELDEIAQEAREVGVAL